MQFSWVLIRFMLIMGPPGILINGVTKGWLDGSIPVRFQLQWADPWDASHDRYNLSGKRRCGKVQEKRLSLKT